MENDSIAQANPQVAEISAETVETTQAAETPAETAVNEDIGKKPDSELTPEQLAKREKNRESHHRAALREQKQRNRELRAEREALQAELLKLRQTATPQDGKPVKPSIDQFETIEDYDKASADYVEALADWKIEQKFNANNKKAEQDQVSQEREYRQAVKAQEIAEAEIELAKKLPEYATLLEQNASFFQGLSQSKTLKEAFAEAENAPLAIFTLMKEDRLDDLLDMSPMRVAAELARAEVRGQAYLSKPLSKAPAPISAARGNTTTKSEDSMSGAELLRKYGLKK